MKWNVWSLTHERWASITSWGRKQAAVEMLEVYQHEAKKDRTKEKFEVRRALPMMESHGTRLMQLKPSYIWAIAMSDFDRRAHNRQADISSMKPYAFHRRHVEGAESANDIIRAAIADPEIGRESAKRDTRLLYSDVELLKAALR